MFSSYLCSMFLLVLYSYLLAFLCFYLCFHRNGNANFVAETRGLWILRAGKLKKYAQEEAPHTSVQCTTAQETREVAVNNSPRHKAVEFVCSSFDFTVDCLFIHSNYKLNRLYIENYETTMFCLKFVCLCETHRSVHCFQAKPLVSLSGDIKDQEAETCQKPEISPTIYQLFIHQKSCTYFDIILLTECINSPDHFFHVGRRTRAVLCRAHWRAGRRHQFQAKGGITLVYQSHWAQPRLHYRFSEARGK